MSLVKAIRHTGIVVQDMEKMVTFYRDLLGMKEVKNFTEQGEYIDAVIGLKNVQLWMIKLVTEDGAMVELLKYHSHPSELIENKKLCNLGCSHVAFTVNSLDETYKILKAYGVEFTSVPYPSPEGYAKVTFCQDPEGNFIELVEVLNRGSK